MENFWYFVESTALFTITTRRYVGEEGKLKGKFLGHASLLMKFESFDVYLLNSFFAAVEIENGFMALNTTFYGK